jgi:hypothetical protein
MNVPPFRSLSVTDYFVHSARNLWANKASASEYRIDDTMNGYGKKMIKSPMRSRNYQSRSCSGLANAFRITPEGGPAVMSVRLNRHRSEI